jgi:hypothetical protein
MELMVMMERQDCLARQVLMAAVSSLSPVL